MKKRKIFRNLNDKEFAWVLYDVGNSAYTMLACALIPIWFKAMAIGTRPGQLTSDQATAYYSMAIAVITIVVALLGPVCGAISDHKGMKKIFFTTTVAVGVSGCILNGFAYQWIAFLLLFAVTKIFYNMSLMFYDSMLNDITTEERMDEVSSYGFAWGYLGSCIPFLIALVAYVLGPDMAGMIPGRVSMAIGFAVTGLWWLLVTIPLMKNYKQLNYVEHQGHAVGNAFRKIFQTVKFIATEDKKVFFFLIAFFLYIDGVGTIIDNCINIGTDLNLSTVGQVICLAGNAGRCIWRITGVRKTVKKIRYRSSDPGMYRGLFCRLSVCADVKKSAGIQLSGIRCRMLSGVDPVPVEILFFQNYSAG